MPWPKFSLLIYLLPLDIEIGNMNIREVHKKWNTIELSITEVNSWMWHNVTCLHWRIHRFHTAGQSAILGSQVRLTMVDEHAGFFLPHCLLGSKMGSCTEVQARAFLYQEMTSDLHALPEILVLDPCPIYFIKTLTEDRLHYYQIWRYWKWEKKEKLHPMTRSKFIDSSTKRSKWRAENVTEINKFWMVGSKLPLNRMRETPYNY